MIETNINDWNVQCILFYKLAKECLLGRDAN